MRLFLAGEIPDVVKQTLHGQLEPVRASTPQARWTPAGSLHLTLVFLGSVPDASAPALEEAFGAVCGRSHPLSLRLSGVETFGPSRSPRVLAITLGGDVEALQGMVADARRVASAVVPLEPERPFRPHLTVARAPSVQGDPLLGRCRTALGHVLDGEFVLRDVALMRSDTRPTGAVHATLARWTLPG